jgi:hypothetical protein
MAFFPCFSELCNGEGSVKGTYTYGLVYVPPGVNLDQSTYSLRFDWYDSESS